MDREDPEQYIRDLERGVGETPEAAPFPAPPQPFSTPFNRQFGGPAAAPNSRRRYGRGFGVSRSLRPRRKVRMLTWAGVVAIILIGAFLRTGVLHSGNPFGQNTVHGNMIMENSGAKDTIACNNGDLKLDGDNNTYTITGHCLRLGVFGSANHVTVDSADTISAFGDDNAMIYHSGSPTINKTGNNNTVSAG